MRIILKDFLKGILLGLLFLPLEFFLLSSVTQPVQAQDLREEIRSQVSDPRDIRGAVPCEIDPREGCARPIPRESAAPQPSVQPSAQPSAPPQPSPEPSPPGPSVPPGVSPSPGVFPSPAVGGPEPSPEEEECEECEEAEEKVIIIEVERPKVLGLPYTGSGKW